jgi:hypothetical protein
MSPVMELQAARGKAQELVDLVKTDAGFARRLQQDPHGTLATVGFDHQWAPLHEQGAITDVSAFYPGCADTTCWTSDCPGTCFVSIRLR